MPWRIGLKHVVGSADEMRTTWSNVAETPTDVSTDTIDSRCQDCEHALALNGSHVKVLSDFTGKDAPLNALADRG